MEDPTRPDVPVGGGGESTPNPDSPEGPDEPGTTGGLGSVLADGIDALGDDDER